MSNASKIYNKLVLQWNKKKNRYDEVFEDSFTYNGPLELAQRSQRVSRASIQYTTTPPAGPAEPPVEIESSAPEEEFVNTGTPISSGGTMKALNSAEGVDRITDTLKVTAGYFTGGSGLLEADEIYTGSLADSNEKYYVNLTQAFPDSASAETQFAVAYGHIGGSGSLTDGGDVYGQTEAVYRQWAGTLLGETEVSGGFRISANEGSGPDNQKGGDRDEDIYIMVGKRARFKDRINKGNWTIALSGSLSERGGAVAGTSGSQILHLTDDSETTSPTSTVAGPRYNIVSGTQGTVSGSGASDRNYGWLYPEMGVMVFSATELSASVPGTDEGTRVTCSFGTQIATENAGYASASGFAPALATGGDMQNAIRFANCLQPDGAYLKFRSEEDQVSVSYFCRAKSNEFNFSNNPTFVSGSTNSMRHSSMQGNPNVFISTVGLFNGSGVMVAMGKLSTPLTKNFSSEATIKVKLTY